MLMHFTSHLDYCNTLLHYNLLLLLMMMMVMMTMMMMMIIIIIHQNKIDKYARLAITHIFYPFAIENTWHDMAIRLTQQIGRRVTIITEDIRETTFLFQRLSMALQKENAVSFQNTTITE